MKMQVLNNLVCRPPIVAQDVIAIRVHRLRHRSGNLAQTRTHRCEHRRLALMDLAAMFLWNYQRVTITHRPDIQEGKDHFVLVNFGCRNFPSDHSAEHAIIHDLLLCNSSPQRLGVLLVTIFLDSARGTIGLDGPFSTGLRHLCGHRFLDLTGRYGGGLFFALR